MTEATSTLSAGMVVAVRIRPPNAGDDSQAMSVQSISSSDSAGEGGSDGSLLQVNVGEGGSSATFQFDHVLWSSHTSKDQPTTASQEDVYAALGAPLVANALLGFHCTLFAYGQTGAGKTHTMIGDLVKHPAHPTHTSSTSSTTAPGSCSLPPLVGLIPRICHGMLAASRTQEEEKEGSDEEGGREVTEFSYAVTYVEIFLERVRDLLLPPPSFRTPASAAASNSSTGVGGGQTLRVREHPTDGPFVEGATVAPVTCDEECTALLRLGELNRHTASTKMNDSSSRSHAIFSLTCTQTRSVRGGAAGGVVNTVVSKINLVDLAGSENAITSGSVDQASRLKEGAAINKSLLALGRVIKILAENARSPQSAPPAAPSPSSTTPEPEPGSGRRRTVGASASRRASTSSSSRSSSAHTPGCTQEPDDHSAAALTPPLVPPSSGSRSNRRASLGADVTPPARRTPPRQQGQGQGQGRQLVPYRDSVLTYLLKESLGGNAKTTMVASVRPGMEFAEETMNTLKYAAQARKIVNAVTVNENPYMKMIRQLQAEVERLSLQLAASSSSSLTPSPRPRTRPRPQDSSCTDLFSEPVTTNIPNNNQQEIGLDLSATGLAIDLATVDDDLNLDAPESTDRNNESTERGSESRLSESRPGSEATASSEGANSVPQSVASADFDADSDAAGQRLRDLQYQMRLAVQSSEAAQRSHEKHRQQRLQGAGLGGGPPSPDSLVWRQLALQLELEELEREEEEESTSGHTTPRALTPTSSFCAADSTASDPSAGWRDMPPRPVRIDRNTLDETREKTAQHPHQQVSSEVDAVARSCDYADCHAQPVLVTADGPGLKYTPKKGAKDVLTAASTAPDSYYVSSGSIEQVPPEERVLKAGFLMKRGFVNTAFKRRWCVLKGRDVSFFRRYRDSQERGRICCAGATVEPYLPVENLPFAFWLHTPADRHHQKWLLQAASEEELCSWREAVEAVARAHVAEDVAGEVAAAGSQCAVS